jgi:truncated hemoglobin YjbI
MNQIISRARASALPPAAAAGPLLPRADKAVPAFGGYHFSAGAVPAETSGVFVLTRQVGDFLYPVLIGQAQDIATALADFKTQNSALAQEIDGWLWMERAHARQQSHIVRELIGKFHPPLNTEHRKGRAATEIAALVPDRAIDLGGTAAVQHLAAEISVTEEELVRLVREFYTLAQADPLIGPVFNCTIVDWEKHYEVVHDFWSRTLLGTTRYKGNPFTPHLTLHLKPEYFDRWIELFKSTAQSVLQPVAAQRAIAKVEHMSTCFQAGLFLPSLPE